MHPVFASLLWPIVEGAVSRHVKNKGEADKILHSLRDGLKDSLSDEAILAELSQNRQHQLNLNALQHRSLYLAGWRPLAGWVCALGAAWVFLGAPVARTILAAADMDMPLPELPADHLFELLLGLLGMAGIRSFDKLKGRTDAR